jgi:hypothetical protein
MSGQLGHGFVEAEIDYRHAQLMAEVAQVIEVRRSRRRWFHDVIRALRIRHHALPKACTGT